MFGSGLQLCPVSLDDSLSQREEVQAEVGLEGGKRDAGRGWRPCLAEKQRRGTKCCEYQTAAS